MHQFEPFGVCGWVFRNSFSSSLKLCCFDVLLDLLPAEGGASMEANPRDFGNAQKAVAVTQEFTLWFVRVDVWETCNLQSRMWAGVMVSL